MFRWDNSGISRDPICTTSDAPPSTVMLDNCTTIGSLYLLLVGNVKGKNVINANVSTKVACLIKRYVCIKCWKDISNSSITAMLARIHNHIKPFECTERGKDFSNSSYIDMLPRIHIDMKLCKCTKCGKDFSNLFDLHSHAHKNPYWHGIIWMH